MYQVALPLSTKTLTLVAEVIRRHRREIGSRWRKLPEGKDIKSSTQAELQLRSLILELDDEVRAQIDRRRIADLTSACAELTPIDGTSIALRALACRRQHLDEEVQDNDTHVDRVVRQTAPGLLARPGIGPICAAQLLVTSGDNPDRLDSEAAFAALCGKPG